MHSATSAVRAIHPEANPAVDREQRPTEEPPLPPFPDGQKAPLHRFDDGGPPLPPLSDGHRAPLLRFGNGGPPLLPLDDGHGVSPGRAAVHGQGCEPLDSVDLDDAALEGRQSSVALPGLETAVRGDSSRRSHAWL